MRLFAVFLVLYFDFGLGSLWPKGVVHYAINKKDYDIHSQDIIMSTFDQIQKEICVKFFNTPMGQDHNVTVQDKILYITNKDKRKTCPPDHYDFEGSVVDMPIGYKCLDQRSIARIVIDMLRASIEPGQNVNSFDLMRKFQAQDEDPSSTNLLSATDRNFINAHYHKECGELTQKLVQSRRYPGETMLFSRSNQIYYRDKIWPLAIVMYKVDEDLRSSPEYGILKYAMTTIELASCVVFQEIVEDDVLVPKNYIWFSKEGEELPMLGFTKGQQKVQLSSMAHGAPGHSAHTLNLLMRVLGMPMMSNRFDRDNYITINWKNMEKGKEHYLEKTPAEAWMRNPQGEDSSYDFDSVTHAPANFMCRDCSLGAQTVQPVQDHLWQRTLTMGHRTDLSTRDIEMLSLLYTTQCQRRFLKPDNNATSSVQQSLLIQL